MTDTSRLITDVEGSRGELLSDPEASADRVAVQLESGPRVQVDPRQLKPEERGGYRYEGAFSEASARDDVVEERRIPVAREEAEIRRERRETARVRITKNVRAHEETIQEPVREETVSVERVPLDQVIETPPTVREEGDVLIIPVVEERLVVRKELVLKEEIRVTRQQHQQMTTETVTLRREEANVEREEGADGAPDNPAD